MHLHYMILLIHKILSENETFFPGRDMMTIKLQPMDIKLICKYAPNYALNYYVVFDGQCAGIYTEYDQAEEAAWFSTERVDTVKSRSGAISALKRYHKKMNSPS